VGIATTPTGAVWTTRLDSGVDYSVAAGGSAIARGPGNALFTMLNIGGTGPSTDFPQLYTSTNDGMAWTDLGLAGGLQNTFNDFYWDGTLYAAIQGTGSPDFLYGLWSSPTALNGTWSEAYDDTLNSDLDILRLYAPAAPPLVTGNDSILMMREVTGGRLASPFSRLGGLPSPFISIRQIYNPLSVSQEDSFILLGLGTDGSAYELFGGTQDGTVTATAVTQPLPTLEDAPGELWDTQKTFRALYVEGVDINNFTVSFSVDGGATYPWGPYPLTQDYEMGISGKQVTIKFVHAAVTALIPQLTYIRLDYDIAAGVTQGSQ
jgi:hypothetical protein